MFLDMKELSIEAAFELISNKNYENFSFLEQFVLVQMPLNNFGLLFFLPLCHFPKKFPKEEKQEEKKQKKLNDCGPG